MTNVRYIKLKSGEVIISEVTDSDDKILSLRNPLQLTKMAYNDKPNQIIEYLLPWAPFSDDSLITLNKEFIVSSYRVNEVFKSFYDVSLKYEQEVIDPTNNERIKESVHHMHSAIEKSKEEDDFDDIMVDEDSWVYTLPNKTRH